MRRGRPLFQSSRSKRRPLKVVDLPSRRSKSRSPTSLSLKNLSRKLNRSFLGSSESGCLDGRSVESMEPLVAMREAEAKAVFGGPRTMSSRSDGQAPQLAKISLAFSTPNVEKTTVVHRREVGRELPEFEPRDTWRASKMLDRRGVVSEGLLGSLGLVVFRCVVGSGSGLARHRPNQSHGHCHGRE